MMTIAIGLSAYNLALFHLLGHAFFKALLFMSAGSIIHSILNESQDIRTYGGLLNYLPYTYISITIASLSLMAMPGLTGYYTKDIIIESTYGSFTLSNYIVYWIAYLSAVLTCVYSMKILYLTFYSNPNNNTTTYINAHESNIYITLPMFILAIFAMFAGWLLKDIYLGVGTEFVGTHVLPNNFSYYDTEFSITQLYKLLPLISAILISILIVILNEFYPIVFNLNNKYINIIYSIFNQKLVSDQILNYYFIFKGLVKSGHIANYVDKGTLYQLGPVGINKLLNTASHNVINLSSNTRSSLSMNSMLILITIVSLLLFVFVLSLNILAGITILFGIMYILFSSTDTETPIKKNTRLDNYTILKGWILPSLMYLLKGLYIIILDIWDAILIIEPWTILKSMVLTHNFNILISPEKFNTLTYPDKYIYTQGYIGAEKCITDKVEIFTFFKTSFSNTYIDYLLCYSQKYNGLYYDITIYDKTIFLIAWFIIAFCIMFIIVLTITILIKLFKKYGDTNNKSGPNNNQTILKGSMWLFLIYTIFIIYIEVLIKYTALIIYTTHNMIIMLFIYISEHPEIVKGTILYIIYPIIMLYMLYNLCLHIFKTYLLPIILILIEFGSLHKYIAINDDKSSYNNIYYNTCGVLLYLKENNIYLDFKEGIKNKIKYDRMKDEALDRAADIFKDYNTNCEIENYKAVELNGWLSIKERWYLHKHDNNIMWVHYRAHPDLPLNEHGWYGCKDGEETLVQLSGVGTGRGSQIKDGSLVLPDSYEIIDGSVTQVVDINIKAGKLDASLGPEIASILRDDLHMAYSSYM